MAFVVVISVVVSPVGGFVTVEVVVVITAS
jgi:hypothetical protein